MRPIRQIGIAIALSILSATAAATALAGLVTPGTDVVVDGGRPAALDTSSLPTFKSLTIGNSGAGSLEVFGENDATVAGPARLGVQQGSNGSMHMDGSPPVQLHLDPADRTDPLLGGFDPTLILSANHILGHFANARPTGGG